MDVFGSTRDQLRTHADRIVQDLQAEVEHYNSLMLKPGIDRMYRNRLCSDRALVWGRLQAWRRLLTSGDR